MTDKGLYSTNVYFLFQSDEIELEGDESESQLSGGRAAINIGNNILYSIARLVYFIRNNILYST